MLFDLMYSCSLESACVRAFVCNAGGQAGGVRAGHMLFGVAAEAGLLRPCYAFGASVTFVTPWTATSRPPPDATVYIGGARQVATLTVAPCANRASTGTGTGVGKDTAVRGAGENVDHTTGDAGHMHSAAPSAAHFRFVRALLG